MQKQAALILALGLCTSAYSADWQPIAMTKTSIFLIDRTSIAKADKYVKAWVSEVLSEPRELQNTYPKKSYMSDLTLYYCDCQARTLASKQEMYYEDNRRQSLVSSQTNILYPTSFKDVGPETIGEAMIEAMCTNRKK